METDLNTMMTALGLKAIVDADHDAIWVKSYSSPNRNITVYLNKFDRSVTIVVNYLSKQDQHVMSLDDVSENSVRSAIDTCKKYVALQFEIEAEQSIRFANNVKEL